MNWNARSIIGLGVGAFALTMFAESVYHTIAIGSCTLGGSYGATRECPVGTGPWIAALVAGVIVPFAAFAIGAVPRATLLAWAGQFLGAGSACAVAALDGSVVGSEGRLTVGILAAVFLPLGLAPLGAALVRASKWRAVAPTEPASGGPPPAALDSGSTPELGDLLGSLQNRSAPPRPPSSES
jgi:hypothetical protein